MSAYAVYSRQDPYSPLAEAKRDGDIPKYDVTGPVSHMTRTFTYQSYFDNTALEKAILEQRPNEPIIAGTYDERDTAGYAIGLHPASETPIAIQFKGTTAGQRGDSGTVIVPPGGIVRPQGPANGSPGAFSGFRWGLPFGWLGGGTATIYIFVAPEAWAHWDSKPEVVFHRFRTRIVAPASIPALEDAAINWPLRFPWSNAFSGDANHPQRGAPAIMMTPTRTFFRIRLATLASAARLRVLSYQIDHFDRTSTTPSTLGTTVSYTDLEVPTLLDLAASAVSNQFPIVELPGAFGSRFGGDSCKVVLSSESADLQGVYVDVLRYGTFG